MDFDPAGYGPVIAGVLAPARVMSLDAGKAEAAERDTDLNLDRLFAHARIADADAARACAAALWLYRDELARAHAAAQALETPEGSYWHGILHRREGDYDNAKYWFRRVDKHPVHARLAADARLAVQGIDDPRAGPLRIQNDWDAFAFVDLCAVAVREGGEIAQACSAVQQREWELLFDHCYGMAVGRP